MNKKILIIAIASVCALAIIIVVASKSEAVRFATGTLTQDDLKNFMVPDRGSPIANDSGEAKDIIKALENRAERLSSPRVSDLREFMIYLVSPDQNSLAQIKAASDESILKIASGSTAEIRKVLSLLQADGARIYVSKKDSTEKAFIVIDSSTESELNPLLLVKSDGAWK